MLLYNSYKVILIQSQLVVTGYQFTQNSSDWLESLRATFIHVPIQNNSCSRRIRVLVSLCVFVCLSVACWIYSENAQISMKISRASCVV